MKNVLIDNKVIPVTETKTVLSFKYPSPKWASDIFNIWLVINAVAMLYMATFTIPEDTEMLILKIMGFGTGAMRIITKAFGLEVKEG